MDTEPQFYKMRGLRAVPATEQEWVKAINGKIDRLIIDKHQLVWRTSHGSHSMYPITSCLVSHFVGLAWPDGPWCVEFFYNHTRNLYPTLLDCKIGHHNALRELVESGWILGDEYTPIT